MANKPCSIKDKLRKKMRDSVYDEEEYDPEDPPWPPRVEPTRIEANARIWLRDLEKRIRYFERFFGGGGSNIIADVKSPKNAAADLIIEAMEAKHKAMVVHAEIITAKARGQAELSLGKAEELVAEARNALTHTKATMATHLKAVAGLQEQLDNATNRMQSLRREGETVAHKVQEAEEQAMELQLQAHNYASRNAVLTIQGDVAGLRTRVARLERRHLGDNGHDAATRGRAFDRADHPTRKSSIIAVERPMAAAPVSIEELIKGAQKRAISERRGNSPTRGCFTPSTSRQPSCDGWCGPSQEGVAGATVTRGRVISRTPSPN